MISAASVTRAVLARLVDDPARAATIAAEVDEWIAANPEEVGPHEVAWASARAIAGSLTAIDEGVASPISTDRLAPFRDLPVGAQVVVVLARFATLSIAEIAAVTQRPIEDVQALIDAADTAAISSAATSNAATSNAALTATTEEPGVPLPPPPVPVPAAAAGSGPPPLDDAAAPPRPKRGSSAKWLVVAVVVVLALIAGGIATRNLGDSDTDAQPTATTPPTLVEPAFVDRDQLSAGCSTPGGSAELLAQTAATTVDSIERTYRVVAAPPAAQGAPRPLILDFGDLAQTVGDHVNASGTDALAVSLGAVVVTPISLGALYQWNVTDAAEAPSDINLAAAIIGRETVRFCIDQRRVLIIGFGGGAHMAASAACALPGLVTAAVLVAGAYAPDPCSADTSQSLMLLTGTNDRFYPPEGGTGPDYAALVPDPEQLGNGSNYEPAAAEDAVQVWTSSRECRGAANRSISGVEVQISTDCANDTEIWSVQFAAGHQWFEPTNGLITQFVDAGPLGTR